jgi:phosphoglycerol transferase
MLIYSAFNFYCRGTRQKLKRILVLPSATIVLLLFLFSIYETLKHESLRTCADVFLYLCEEMNIKFIAAALVIDTGLISIMKFGIIDMYFGKSNISKAALSLLLFPLFLMYGSFRFKELYAIVPVEQLIFHVMMPETGANFNMLYEIIILSALDTALLFSALILIFSVNLTLKKTGKTICLNTGKKVQYIAEPVFAAVCIVLFFINMGFSAYIVSHSKPPSTFYEEYYIDPNSVEITFPKRKRNLIVILVESLETGFLTRENGGAFNEHLMPQIETLLKTNINFSASNGPGGAYQLPGTGWSIAGITAQYSGVPLNLGFKGNDYGKLFKQFLPGASSVGDILYKAGYKTYFFLGAEIKFGGLDKYFATHKNTIIYDYNYFSGNGYIPKDYYVWWGIEDRKVYAFAKDIIPEITKAEPFFITIETADTHPPAMYLDADALEIFNSRQKNVLYSMDSQLSNFLAYLAEQPFYENTTIVVLGDHLYMESDIFPNDFNSGISNRFPLNIFINSLLNGRYSKNRLFSHFDIFPAIIESIGGSYDAPGLGLGRSMNKGERTLLELLGVDYVNNVLPQKSAYYNNLWTAVD